MHKVTVSIRRLGLGVGYAYLMHSVARGDLGSPTGAASTPLTRYYAESGTPPGRWLGRGLAGLADGVGVEVASTVTEQGLWRLLGLLSDPATGAPLGARPTIVRSSDASAESRARRAPVAGFDLTLSVPKSVSVLWALAPPDVQTDIHRIHRDAIDLVLSWAEQNITFTRTGVNGTFQEPIRGLVAAAFDHWDSRAGDPHLHTHVVVANRVQTLDGRWRTLDSRTLFRYTVALSELHEGLLHDLLTERLGIAWTPHTRTHSPSIRWDVTGVPTELIDAFSQRSHAIRAEKDQLVTAFVDQHGRHPRAVEVLKLRQQATLATRPDKEHTTVSDLMHEWRSKARQVTGQEPADLTGKPLHIESRTGHTNPDEATLAVLEKAVLETVSTKRAVFGEANVLAESHRVLQAHTFTDPADRLAVGDKLTQLALLRALPLDPRPTSDGALPPPQRGARRYTTSATLDAETRLLDAASTLDAPTAQPVETAPPLGNDQRAAVDALATSGRVLDLLTGPAGAGKTTALAALRARWEATHGPNSVLGLAPSAGAAQVLADELGLTTENTAKWLHEHDRNDERQVQLDAILHDLARCRVPASVRARRLTALATAMRDEQNRWQLHPGQLVLIDEASLADTRILDRLVQHATDRSAKVVLVGDPAQLGSVDAGGMFALLTQRHPGAELTDIRRFTHRWEADATRRLRAGDTTVVDTYIHHHRVAAGATDDMMDQALCAWLADTRAGANSVLIATDEDTVRALNHLAQAHLIDAGVVQNSTAHGALGVTLGVGDHIITRRNDRRLRTHNGWVKNGDTWTIVDTHRDGSLTVHNADGKATHLPRDYVLEHAELGYAVTAHRTQGRTCDTAHAVLDERCTREAVYVALTRGRHSNRLYLTDVDTRDPELDSPDVEPRDPRQTLIDMIDRSAAQQTAVAATGITVIASEMSRSSPAVRSLTPPSRLAPTAIVIDS